MAESTKYMLILALFAFWLDSGSCQSPCQTSKCQPPQFCYRVNAEASEYCLCPYGEKPVPLLAGTCEEDTDNTCPFGLRTTAGADNCFCTGNDDSVPGCEADPSDCGGCDYGTAVCLTAAGETNCHSTTRRFLPACDDPNIACGDDEVCEDIDGEARFDRTVVLRRQKLAFETNEISWTTRLEFRQNHNFSQISNINIIWKFC